jgi:hypothetical protein
MATKKLTVEQFTLQAIRNLRNLAKSKGIHAVYSGFNTAFREYFPKKDVKNELQKLVDDGKIVMVPRRGGPMIYLPDEGPGDASAEDALRRILGNS